MTTAERAVPKFASAVSWTLDSRFDMYCAGFRHPCRENPGTGQFQVRSPIYPPSPYRPEMSHAVERNPTRAITSRLSSLDIIRYKFPVGSKVGIVREALDLARGIRKNEPIKRQRGEQDHFPVVWRAANILSTASAGKAVSRVHGTAPLKNWRFPRPRDLRIAGHDAVLRPGNRTGRAIDRMVYGRVAFAGRASSGGRWYEPTTITSASSRDASDSPASTE